MEYTNTKNYTKLLYIVLTIYFSRKGKLFDKDNVIIISENSVLRNKIYNIRFKNSTEYCIVIYDNEDNRWYVDEYDIIRKDIIRCEDINNFKTNNILN